MQINLHRSLFDTTILRRLVERGVRLERLFSLRHPRLDMGPQRVTEALLLKAQKPGKTGHNKSKNR